MGTTTVLPRIVDAVRAARDEAAQALRSGILAELAAATTSCMRARTSCALRTHLPDMQENVGALDALIDTLRRHPNRQA